MMVQDKEVEIRRFKEMVADKREEGRAVYEGIMKDIWFETMEAERVRMFKIVSIKRMSGKIS